MSSFDLARVWLPQQCAHAQNKSINYVQFWPGVERPVCVGGVHVRLDREGCTAGYRSAFLSLQVRKQNRTWTNNEDARYRSSSFVHLLSFRKKGYLMT